MFIVRLILRDTEKVNQILKLHLYDDDDSDHLRVHTSTLEVFIHCLLLKEPPK